MALTYGDVDSIVRKFYLPKMPQLIFDASPVLSRVAKKGTKADGGPSILQPLIYAASAGGWYQAYDTLNVSNTPQITDAEFQWHFGYSSANLSRPEILKARGKGAVKSLIDTKMKAAAMTLTDQLSTALFAIGAAAGNDTTSAMSALDTLCNDASNTLSAGVTYGGISKSTYSWWAGNVVSGSGTDTPTYAKLAAVLANLIDGPNFPDMGVTHPTIWSAYGQNLQAQQRFVRQRDAESGFRYISIDDVPLYADRHCSYSASTATSNRLYFLDSNALDLVVHKDENLRYEPFQKAYDQAASSAKIYWAGELTSSDPSRHLAWYNFVAA